MWVVASYLSVQQEDDGRRDRRSVSASTARSSLIEKNSGSLESRSGLIALLHRLGPNIQPHVVRPSRRRQAEGFHRGLARSY
jgi:hypothetical protein